NNTKDLLDGQQRSTSILTGFYNPLENENKGVFSIKRFPSIWVDIQSKEKSEQNKYSVHILTQSHPWGFSAYDNSKTLSLSDRRKALEYFKTKTNFSSYLDIRPQYHVPWDSVCPVPLCFILELADSDSFDEFEKGLTKKLAKLKVTTKHSANIN